MLGLQWRVVPLLLLGACAGSQQGPNSLYRSRLEITLTEREAEVVRLEDRLWAIRQEIADAERAADEAEGGIWRTDAELREKTLELGRQVRTLQAVEEDLLAVRDRKAAIEVELAEVRELEEQLARKEQRMTELAGLMAGADAELADKEAAFARRQAEMTARFAELEERGKVLDRLESLVNKALEEILAIAGPFFRGPEEKDRD